MVGKKTSEGFSVSTVQRVHARAYKRAVAAMRFTALVLALASTASAFSGPPSPLFASTPGVRLAAPAASAASRFPGTTRVYGQKVLLSLDASAPRTALLSRPASAPANDLGRRHFLAASAFAALVLAPTSPAEAKEAINDCDKWAPGRRWLTGKSCKEKASGDLKGTKKDPQYLRKLQDCKAQGQAPGGKEEANVEINKTCRDSVCSTYEQCTYQIGPKEDYGGFFF